MLANTDYTQQLLKSLSISSIELLLHYPNWRAAVLEASSLKPLPMGFEPNLIEVFDQQGLLVGRINDYVYTVDLPPEHRCEFTAWYFDSELVLFCVGEELVINRLQLVSIAGLFDLGESQ